jgi:hypothetical protein
VKYFQALLLFCLLFRPLIEFSQNLQFYREDLTFEIKDAYFYVDGFYDFCNNSDSSIHQFLFYPFPLDSAYGEVDSINAVDINARSINIISNKTGKGFYFKIALKPYGIGKYKLSYRQRLLKNKAEYILLTTQKWGKPFDNACYKLFTPSLMKINSISYKPDSVKQTSNKAIYYWNKKDFMPDKNMIIYFSE